MNPVSKESAEHYAWGDGCDGWHLLKDDALSVIQERVPPGAAEVRHYHDRSRQFFYVLEGLAVLEVDGDEVLLEAGQGMHVPPGVPHTLANRSESDVHFLVISAPLAHSDRVTAAAP